VSAHCRRDGTKSVLGVGIRQDTEIRMGKENCIFNREMVLSEKKEIMSTINHKEYSG